MRPPARSLAALATALALAVTACGDDAGTSLDLSPQGDSGRRIANSNGCSGCHGGAGQGTGVAPPFVGLYGTEREFSNAPPAVADDVYLSESITDPQAKLVVGYSARMPGNSLDDDEIADVIAYIRDLQDVEP